jgi:RHS repeat-associated protein
VNDPTGTYAFAYDNMGRLVGTTTNYSFLTGTTFTNAYTYDANSNRTGYTAPDGSTNTYTYDALNRLTSLANSWAGSFNFTYDTLSRRTQMTRPNGVNTNYAYDSLSRLLSVLHQNGASTIDGATYTVDATGNRTSKTDQLAGVTSHYTYDAIKELIQVTQAANTTESYTYDSAGNRLSSLTAATSSYNSANELTLNSNTTYTYDANGNTTTKTDSTGITTYAWDFENRLTSVTLPNTGGIVNFKYDPSGRRIYKSSSTNASIYAYDDHNLIEETDSSGTAVARYFQELNIDEPLAMSRSGMINYYNADGLGSVTSLTSGVGVASETYTYDSFGNLTTSAGSLINPFHYTGREFDTETGLYFYRARYVSSQTGRFMSEDPLRFSSGDSNFYDYVAQNPINHTDPSGRTVYYGWWCGPDWTGGLKEEYRPDHSAIYKNPIDGEDRVCMHHDICYFNCRSSKPCDPEGRSNCFTTCDQIYVGEMPHSFVGNSMATVMYFHQFFTPPGPNAKTCPTCSASKHNPDFGPGINNLLKVGIPHAVP